MLGGSYLFWASHSGPFLWTPPLFLLFLVGKQASNGPDVPMNPIAVTDLSAVASSRHLLHHSSQEWTPKTQSPSGWLRSCLRYKHFRRWSPDSDRCALMPQSLPVWNALWRSKPVCSFFLFSQYFFYSSNKRNVQKNPETYRADCPIKS